MVAVKGSFWGPMVLGGEIEVLRSLP